MTKQQPALVRKAVFPVAGLGTRFLPATKASPKEMLPVVDKPLIQYAVEEAAASTINCIYIRQPEALGLGHAVLCARPVVGDEPFAVILADDLMDVGESGQPVMAQMTALYEEHRASIVAVQDVPRQDTSRYGIVASSAWGRNTERLTDIVEKPHPDVAPSTLAVVGRYLLTPRIFGILADQAPGAGGEIQLTDAIQKLLTDEPVLAYRFNGTRFDCGSKQGYLRATVTLARRHAEEGPQFEAWLRESI
ncbi:MAG: UTP--glucose-phosphate uridylyltransferase [Pseudomonadota bacterium]